MTITKKSPGYRGILKKPMSPLLDQQSDEREWKKRIIALFDHYDIDIAAPGADFKLVLALIQAHNIAGFQYRVPKKTGSPVKWTDQRRAELAIAVDSWKAKPGRTAKDAYRKAAREKKWRSLCQPRQKQKTDEVIPAVAKRLEAEASKGRKTLWYKRWQRVPQLEKLYQMFCSDNIDDQLSSEVAALLQSIPSDRQPS